MNQKKAKALRREARKAASQFPDAHSKDTYQDIVREVVKTITVKNPEPLGKKLWRILRGKAAPPKTKTKDIVTKRTIQTVLASGPKFILRRLKAALRRGEFTIQRNGPQNYSFPETPKPALPYLTKEGVDAIMRSGT